ncbi:hypothetical protein VaNZ11_002861 [Volvox africanus]|uniref:MiT/TFE transcription factors N-terminal domain-containing protein n=1 Tax=Volvox africanus TaxID=51714 RepID=A0ABQ5RSU5_9CHLO|nr:hypothetical protein VaNZ11_002861 [Volvox africanus]
MDSGLRVVGFTFSNHCESTLNADVSNAKLQTQRSLLSELLAIHAVGDDSIHSDSQSDDSEDDDCADDEDVGTEAAPVVRADTFGAQSNPIPIPCPESLANQRVKDAYRRLIYQRQIEQMYYQHQQQLHIQAQQEILIQQQRRLRNLRQQRNQPAAPEHQSGQERAVAVQARGPNATVPVY